MDIRITPSSLSGDVGAIPSKSEAHRALICAALSKKEGRIKLPSLSDDTRATANCLCSLGAGITRSGEYLDILPIERTDCSPAVLDCGESGSTLRFLLPLCAALGREARFIRRGRLAERPMDDICNALAKHGIASDGERVSGKLLPGEEYALSGQISSQYLSGMLIALSASGGGSVRLTSPLASKPYVDITIRVLRDFGVRVDEKDGVYTVPPDSELTIPDEYEVGGDWSAAAFWLPFGIGVSGLDENFPQGDRAVCDILSSFGEKKRSENPLKYSFALPLGAKTDISNTPDLFPPLAAYAALSENKTCFLGTSRLRYKESDRIESTAKMLSSLGGSLVQDGDSVTVFGGKLHGGRVDSFGDHRIAMSAAMLSSYCSDEVVITGADSVNKSYPSFWSDFRSLGGKITEV